MSGIYRDPMAKLRLDVAEQRADARRLAERLTPLRRLLLDPVMLSSLDTLERQTARDATDLEGLGEIAQGLARHVALLRDALVQSNELLAPTAPLDPPAPRRLGGVLDLYDPVDLRGCVGEATRPHGGRLQRWGRGVCARFDVDDVPHILTARGFSYRGAQDQVQVFVSVLTRVAASLPKIIISPAGLVANMLHRLGLGGDELDVVGNEVLASAICDVVRAPLLVLKPRSPALSVENGVLRIDTRKTSAEADIDLALRDCLAVLRSAGGVIARG